uniref:Signal transducing adapter molecule 1 n=1 Tax=Diabrotica virgifera virgifera TaxID=50390 RepID=A0A6P7FSN9_DIAVI
MGIFGTAADAAITEEIETATTEKNDDEDWGLIMTICDKAGQTSDNAKAYFRAIIKRLYHEDPHVGVKAVTLLDACVKNSGKVFHVEVASREFENDFSKLMNKSHHTVAKKLRASLCKWAENEFKSDPQLNLIPSMYNKLKNKGLDCSSTDMPVKKPAPLSKDPDVVESQEEEEQILKAIELSLKESGGSPRSSTNTTTTHSTSLYPSMNLNAPSSAPAGATAAAAPSAKEPRKVRALYDFEAAEDNELTFNSGEILFVLDDSNPNWWKGTNQRGEGLFPANFVTADLSVEPEKFLYEKAKKMVQFKETAEVKVVKDEPEDVEINEQKIDRLLHLLHEADPTNPEKDTDEMLNLEREANGMGPLIDAELEKVDRKHAQLTQLSADLVEALGLYHTLMREPPFPSISKMPYGYPPSSHMPFNGTLPPNAHIPMMLQGNQGPDRAPFMHAPGGVPQAMMQQMHMQHIPPMAGGPQLPHPQMQQQLQGPPQLPPQMQQQMMEERRMEPHMMQYGLPNYGPASSVPQPFPPQSIPGSTSQTNVSNGAQQHPGVQYVTSSTHMTN